MSIHQSDHAQTSGAAGPAIRGLEAVPYGSCKIDIAPVGVVAVGGAVRLRFVWRCSEHGESQQTYVRGGLAAAAGRAHALHAAQGVLAL